MLASALEQEIKLQGRLKRPRASWWSSGTGDYSHVSVDDNSSSLLTRIGLDHEDTIGEASNVYSDADARDIYKPVQGYEGSHRFDHNASWTEQQEKTLVRKVRHL